tara:strand:+ start:37 stop:153 length:117 start_codon:yes stop_codon:yes gene_type:complete
MRDEIVDWQRLESANTAKAASGDGAKAHIDRLTATAKN